MNHIATLTIDTPEHFDAAKALAISKLVHTVGDILASSISEAFGEEADDVAIKTLTLRDEDDAPPTLAELWNEAFDLSGEDIYTDAPECQERIERLQFLLTEVDHRIQELLENEEN